MSLSQFNVTAIYYESRFSVRIWIEWNVVKNYKFHKKYYSEGKSAKRLFTYIFALDIIVGQHYRDNWSLVQLKFGGAFKQFSVLDFHMQRSEEEKKNPWASWESTCCPRTCSGYRWAEVAEAAEAARLREEGNAQRKPILYTQSRILLKSA